MYMTFNHMEEFDWLGQAGIQDTCGILPNWLNQLEEKGVSCEEVAGEMLLMYGFPADPMTGGRFDGDTYKYPGDPDMVPMLTVVMTNGCLIYMYQYGMVAFQVNGSSTLYRLD